jgi:uncharacterized FAD-dependent dehydrogenase
MAQALIINDLLIPVEKDTPAEYLKAAAGALKLPEADIEVVKTLFKSLITTDKRQFFYELSLVVRAPDSFDAKGGFSPYTERPFPIAKKAPCAQRPIVIGFGPAGMFAALELIECGQTPLIFERGKPIEQRHKDIRRFLKERTLDPESNIQFGEGGAGLYSDGKLFSSRNNSIFATKALDTFVRFGAPPEIRFMHKPHIGTDMLCKIVANIRDYIISHGGEIMYSSKMTDIIVQDKVATGVVINGCDQYQSSCIFLALGNSPRDTYEMLHTKGIVLEAKPISVGVRIEHPAKTIDRMKYGNKYQNYPGLGAANYFFNYVNKFTRRAAYTFCMCPGGEVVNASSEKEMLVINGMSYAARDSIYSNSAIVVGVNTTDYKSNHPLAGIEFQRDIERKAFRAGGGTWKAPAQNLTDFLRRKPSASIRPGSFKMGTHPAILDSIFPGFVNETLRQAFSFWKAEQPLFVSEEAILMAAETRTSSPVRIKRKKTFQSVNVAHLYPIGEGSGYSGGINSAAIDAIRAVEAVMGNLVEG